jgi:hypothetical protein
MKVNGLSRRTRFRQASLLCLIALALHGMQSAAQELHVQGELVRTSSRDKDKRSMAFEATFQAELGRIRIKGPIDDVVDLLEWYSDGSESIVVKRFRSDFVTTRTATIVKERIYWTNGPATKPRNQANVFVTQGPIPPAPANLVLGLWLAYGSLPFLTNGAEVPRLFNPAMRSPGSMTNVKTSLIRAEKPPFGPAMLICTNLAPPYETNEVFRVEEWMTLDGLEIPKRFTFEIHYSGALGSATEYIVKEVSRAGSGLLSRIDIPENSAVHDYRFKAEGTVMNREKRVKH